MRCLGIDYGERRIGLAYGDELGVATPLPAAVQETVEGRLARIAELIRERQITDLVVGYPYNMDGSVGFKAKEVDAFIAQLEKQHPLPVHRIDERLTSHSVEQGLGLTGRKERALRKTGAVDSGAATLILQDWLTMNAPVAELDEYDPEMG
ncbi:Holliday junction resolvase RuvX [Puniceicoccales bacterium CK1056]|uniref:Putative pre-16S rRNA nuclease n=2 Tax=Oceanipulchritudo coccoides TaxID=2706888 RepID=A0A6B2M688_9BACT|nr:Holliday junction resolvase RuvX [Oceanipulchritudo coccoides]